MIKETVHDVLPWIHTYLKFIGYNLGCINVSYHRTFLTL